MMQIFNNKGYGISYDNYLSHNPDLEYENDNPAHYKVTFTTDDFTLSMNAQLDDPSNDMDENYTEAKNQALNRLEIDYDIKLLPFDIRETVVQPK
jgi:hypothetical protein